MTMEAHRSGSLVGTGTYRCVACDYTVSLAADDALPPCPRCAGSTFVRASLFADQSTAHETLPATFGDPDEPWVADVRQRLEEPGEYLIYREGDETVVHRLTREWTRIGRSLAADIRFDDPTVSRRHALVVRQPDGVRVLDDRSLNGVFVNGDRIEWRALQDGDQLVVGRHTLHFVAVAAVSGMRDGGPLTTPAPLAR